MLRRSKFLVLFLILFGVFLANIGLGKAQLLFGWNLSFLLSDVAEFLTLLAAAVSFTLAILTRESDAEEDGGPSDTETDPG